MTGVTTLLWFVAAALAWGCLDLAQVRATIGSPGFVALARMTLLVYAVLGALAGVAYLGARRLVGRALDRPRTAVAVAVLLWGIAVVGAYVNIVYLPKPSEPIAMIGNAALAVVGLLLGVIFVRAKLADWLAGRGAAGAIAVIVASLVTGHLIASPRNSNATTSTMAAAPESPDVFVIVVDTLRYDRTSLHPDGPRTTPNIAALAAKGTSFTRAYAQSSWTKPSVASLFTSLFPSTHEANLRRDRLAPAAVTLPELFHSAGYDTAVFSANPWISPAFGFDEGVSYFVESEPDTFVRLVLLLRVLKLGDRVLAARPGTRVVGALETAFGVRSSRQTNCLRDRTLAEAFERWIAKPRTRPRFAYVHLMSPHIPYEPPGREQEFPHAEQVALLQSTEPLPPDRRALLLSLYDDAVRYGDAMVGRILDAMDASGNIDEAILVVTSDHGEEFFEHGRWGHGKSLYDEVVRVPLVLAGPGIARGREVDAPVMLVDVLPTIMRLAGIDVASGLEGANIAGDPTRKNAYAELIREGGIAWYMLVSGEKKLIDRTDKLGDERKLEVYDLLADPGETRSLASASVDPLKGRLDAIRSAAESKRLGSATTEIDAEADERLRALGYTN